jgi:hypothetical protein
VQYFIPGLQAKDVLFQKSIFIVKLLKGFSKPTRSKDAGGINSNIQ